MPDQIHIFVLGKLNIRPCMLRRCPGDSAGGMIGCNHKVKLPQNLVRDIQSARMVHDVRLDAAQKPDSIYVLRKRCQIFKETERR